MITAHVRKEWAAAQGTERGRYFLEILKTGSTDRKTLNFLRKTLLPQKFVTESASRWIDDIKEVFENGYRSHGFIDLWSWTVSRSLRGNSSG